MCLRNAASPAHSSSTQAVFDPRISCGFAHTPCERKPDLRADTMRLNTLIAKAWPHIMQYVLAAALVGICALVRLLLDDYFENKFFLTSPFYPAVIFIAYLYGLGPALFATALSCVAIRMIFMQPTGQLFGLDDPWDSMKLAFFSAYAVLIAYLFSQLQASKSRISAMASEAIQSRDQLSREQEFLRRLINQQEAEKQTLCNDFHDGLIQHVVGSKMLLEAQLHGTPEDESMHAIIQHLSKGIADGRRVIRGIRPSVLDEPGISGPLHELVEHFSTVGFHVDIDCQPDGNVPDVPDQIRTAIFRICQEALTNSWKHSGGTKATVCIQKQGDSLYVEIDDDGCGLAASPQVATKGFGLKGMDARARLLGGSLDVVSQGKGTRIRVRLPLSIEHTA